MSHETGSIDRGDLLTVEGDPPRLPFVISGVVVVVIVVAVAAGVVTRRRSSIADGSAEPAP